MSAPATERTSVHDLADEVVRLREQAAQLQRALDSRVTIEQAKGMLAERLALTPGEAFQLLRRSARSAQMRLHDLAASVIESSSTPEPVLRELRLQDRKET